MDQIQPHTISAAALFELAHETQRRLCLIEARLVQVDEMRKQVQTIHRHLVGNGGVGLFESVRSHDRDLNSLRDVVNGKDGLVETLRRTADSVVFARRWVWVLAGKRGW